MTSEKMTKEEMLQKVYARLDEMAADSVLNEKLEAAESGEEVFQAVQSCGYMTKLSQEEFDQLMKAGLSLVIHHGKPSEELTEEELEMVAGGFGWFSLFKDIAMTAFSTAIGFCAGGPAGAVAGLVKGIVTSVIGETVTAVTGSMGGGAAVGGGIKLGWDIGGLLMKLA